LLGRFLGSVTNSGEGTKVCGLTTGVALQGEPSKKAMVLAFSKYFKERR
jgi:hypothetical protein